MTAFVLYPLYVFRFWYLQAPLRLIESGIEFFIYMARIFSLPLLIRTFFWPLKNEYRKEFILFSIIFGMAVKSALILVTGLFMIGVLLLEVMLFVIFLAFPIFVAYLPFL